VSDLIAGLGELARLASKAPSGARLVAAAARAVGGDAAAIAYLRSVGVYDAAELLQPGAGGALRGALRASAEGLEGVRAAFGRGPVVEGEYRELDADPPERPWYALQEWIARRTWGAWVILGPKGEGKTALALRLAEVWHVRTGYPVECVNVYHDERPAWAESVGLGVLGDRMAALSGYLGLPSAALEDVGDELDDPEADGEDGMPTPRQVALLRSQYRAMMGRVLIVDEAGLAMGPTSTDVGRRLARQAMAQARHLLWHVVYVGQLARQMPTDLLTAEAVFVKRPGGYEHELDRQEPLVQRLWRDAAAAFGELRPEWRAAYPDRRSWAFVDCRHPYYRGPMPFSRPGGDAAPRRGPAPLALPGGGDRGTD
jgi:hypothetical protein